MIVCIERRGAGKVSQCFRASDVAAEQGQRSVEAGFLHSRAEGFVAESAFEPVRRELQRLQSSDESEHGDIHVEVKEKRVRVREDILKGSDDDAQRGLVELMKREPLAEQAAGREPLADGVEVFARVKETRAVLTRVK